MLSRHNKLIFKGISFLSHASCRTYQSEKGIESESIVSYPFRVKYNFWAYLLFVIFPKNYNHCFNADDILAVNSSEKSIKFAVGFTPLGKSFKIILPFREFLSLLISPFKCDSLVLSK